MKKTLSVLTVFILILSMCSMVNAYSTSKYTVDIPSTFSKVTEGSFTSSDGSNFNVQVTSYTGLVDDPFTTSNLNELVSDLKEQINQVNSSIKFKNLDIKEVTTVTKNNYKCFHIQYTYEMLNNEYICEQYSLLSGKDVFTLTSTASTRIKLHSSEMKGIVDSFTVTNYKGKTGSSSSSSSSLLGRNNNSSSSSSNSLFGSNSNSSSSSSSSSLLGSDNSSSSSGLFENDNSRSSSSTFGSNNDKSSSALDVFKDDNNANNSSKKDGFDIFADNFLKYTLIGAGVGALVGLIVYVFGRMNKKGGNTNTNANTNNMNNSVNNMNNNVNNQVNNNMNNNVNDSINNNFNNPVDNNVNNNINNNAVNNDINNNSNNTINNDVNNNVNNNDNNMNN